MKIDKRIKENKMPLTCFHTDEAKQYVDSKGYFTNDIAEYRHLDDCYYGTLNVVDNNSSIPFLNKDFSMYFEFFLPEEFVKQKQKKYMPFKDTKEFFIKTNFESGDLIHLRFKNKIEYWLMLVGWTNNELMLGTDNFTFEYLFENFELWDGEERFIPFGTKD